MGRMPDEFIDLIITSPPYDQLRMYKGYTFPFEKIANEMSRVLKPGGVIVWVVGDAVVDGGETGTSFYQALYMMHECGLKLYDTMIYEKNGMRFPAKNRYNQIFEYMFVMSKGKPTTTNIIKDRKNKYDGTWGLNVSRSKEGKVTTKVDVKTGGKVRQTEKIKYNEYSARFNLWKDSDIDDKFLKKYSPILEAKADELSKIIPSENEAGKPRDGDVSHYRVGGGLTSRDKIAFDHPAIFPEAMVADHIYSWTEKGDVVYDPFMGSGTTAKMAYLLEREWIGSEISEYYVEEIQKPRINELVKRIEDDRYKEQLAEEEREKKRIEKEAKTHVVEFKEEDPPLYVERYILVDDDGTFIAGPFRTLKEAKAAAKKIVLEEKKNITIHLTVVMEKSDAVRFEYIEN